ncbi:uncharacterized protein LOC113771530 [Coffea eugenioides]|uniref:Retrotransposon gag domain-containing protein n=1 Tax=Coffea arabica TaxID=13443 RepID=A0A6P6XE77_COFAR|nr:uncharacterized protein LOC113741019 [Coffea arabica]XP_027166750.1 uncharacterized protein LOC113766798 [Coffea eugenioides]XP_027169561.1 uncharacterized protein LOC113769298 [Coffea eugenioides]XP_027171907.1 uncharacterized protein LOC113771530 [Coffea eugenioides]
MANARTIRELAAPNLTQQPLCITFPRLSENAAFELKPGPIHLLPTFHGLSGEEPHKHMQEFDVVCSSMKPSGVTDEQIKLKAFPFSLKDSAKDWLYCLPAGIITTWPEMQKKFFEKYFPASRAASLRKEICDIKQFHGESLYEYWERNIIDAASGGALVNKTTQEAWELIERMAENCQQFGTREDVPTRKVNEVSSSSIQQQLSELTSFVRQIAVGNVQQAKVCGICTNSGHTTDSCPQLQEEGIEQANMAGNMPMPRRQYDPYSNSYNPGWRDHPNLSYGGNKQQNFTPNRQQGFQQQYQTKNQPSSNPGMSLEDMVKIIASNTMKFQQDTEASSQETKARMQNLENQMSQLASIVNRLDS